MDLKSVSKAWSSDTLAKGQDFMESQGQPRFGPPPVQAGFVFFQHAKNDFTIPCF